MTSLLKETIRISFSRLIVGSGVTAVSRRIFPKQGAIILYGHRVTHDDEGFLQGLAPEWLDDQLAYLTRHFDILPLIDIIQCLEDRRQVPKASLAITFDDGFRDNLENAFPLFEKYHVPVTIFLVTGSTTNGELPWSQRLGVMFQKSGEETLRHTILGREPMDLSTETSRRWSYTAVKRRLMTLSREVREQALGDLEAALRVDPPKDRMLSWEDARYLMSRGVCFGAHTYSHPYLASIADDEATWEMERSRDDLKRHLGVERPVFCFPAGSLNSRLVNTVRRLGFRGSFVSSPIDRVNRLENVDPFSMHRTGMPNGPAVQLEAELDGPLPFLRKIYRIAKRPFTRRPDTEGP